MCHPRSHNYSVLEGDWMVDFEDDIAAVLDAGHPVLIYAGECVQIVNRSLVQTHSYSRCPISQVRLHLQLDWKQSLDRHILLEWKG